jgi:DNA ligase (NAD+)
MTQDIQAFMLQLRSSLEKYNEAYFLRQEELVPESVREQLKAQLFALEKQYPQYATADSPTQTVGSGVDTRFQSVTHTFRKYSLEDVFSLDELQMWVARFQKASGFSGFPQLIAEYKVDGLNMTLELKQGIVVRALTRGDGFVGEDVTHTIAPLFRGQQFGSLDGFVS